MNREVATCDGQNATTRGEETSRRHWRRRQVLLVVLLERPVRVPQHVVDDEGRAVALDVRHTAATRLRP